MKIAIVGASGTIGRYVETAARAAGHETLAMTRASGVDLSTATTASADSLAERLAGVDAVIDVTSTGSLSTAVAVSFFSTVTQNLLAAERRAGVPHHVALSIIGAAAADSGYYAGKAAQEREIMKSGDGWSLLRASQFHEFAQQSVARGTGVGIQLVPAMRSQPIAAAEVAAELLRIATAEPIGLAPDLAGPLQESMPDMVRRYLRSLGLRRPVLGVALPGAMGRAMRNGGLLPAPGTRLGQQSFQQWLEQRAADRPPRHPQG
ncbi:NAD(P)H-binding protein [Subtercola sp. PAMC28395]|uniref:SDR family oxidoreductase n=1 Tax=Subtercola sp. PAMC28395 TaxID=2846775 RepID=UPI001C0E28F9|nr:NAD(P)H-binding protein [Subtercola sp. PAMC28395]QWT24494.1 NAD(P)H-binding protein [Subtercola sp. PAMC28395]